MPDYDNSELIELARHLLANDPSLIDEVRLAIDRPHEYVGRFKERLKYRGIHKPRDDLPGIALIDGLMARGHLQKIDWEASWDEVQLALEVLTGQKEEWAWLAAAEWEDKRPDEVFPAIKECLSRKGLALVCVHIEWDSYPLMVLPIDRFEEARRLALLAGYGPMLSASEDYVAEQVPELGLRYSRPGWWQFRLEDEEEPATYLYWDEYTGSLRITPRRVARPSFSAADFLIGVLDRERERGHAPEWRLIQGRRFVCWRQDNAETGTRTHFYITAHEDRIVTCSFAYALSLLDDEYSADELEGAMEDADHVLESLTLS